MEPGEIIGLGVLAVAVVIAVWSALLSLRVRKDGSMLEGMVQLAFLPEKRRTYLLILAIEGNLLLDAAIVWALGLVGVLPGWLVTPAVGLCLGGGAIAVGALTWLGLRPRHLTNAERVTMQARAPQILESLAFAAYAAHDTDDPVG
ncbi:MAG: hypothetical protein L3K16_00275 [Thermoplasmata archaeon]|nr:hypothetical protein [Thermoplasmata archaeon]